MRGSIGAMPGPGYQAGRDVHPEEKSAGTPRLAWHNVAFAPPAMGRDEQPVAQAANRQLNPYAIVRADANPIDEALERIDEAEEQLVDAIQGRPFPGLGFAKEPVASAIDAFSYARHALLSLKNNPGSPHAAAHAEEALRTAKVLAARSLDEAAAVRTNLDNLHSALARNRAASGAAADYQRSFVLAQNIVAGMRARFPFARGSQIGQATTQHLEELDDEPHASRSIDGRLRHFEFLQGEVMALETTITDAIGHAESAVSLQCLAMRAA